MSTSTQPVGETPLAVVEQIREVCEQADQPTEIWDALDAKGIEATPGLVHQAIHDAADAEPPARKVHPDAKLALDSGTGLTAEDIEQLVELAEKLGGVQALITALRAIQHAA